MKYKLGDKVILIDNVDQIPIGSIRTIMFHHPTNDIYIPLNEGSLQGYYVRGNEHKIKFLKIPDNEIDFLDCFQRNFRDGT